MHSADQSGLGSARSQLTNWLRTLVQLKYPDWTQEFVLSGTARSILVMLRVALHHMLQTGVSSPFRSEASCLSA